MAGGPHICSTSRLGERSIISYKIFYEMKFFTYIRLPIKRLSIACLSMSMIFYDIEFEYDVMLSSSPPFCALTNANLRLSFRFQNMVVGVAVMSKMFLVTIIK